MNARPLLPILTALAFTACGEASPANTEATASRDSAGISIVENGAPAWTEATAWHLSDQPTLAMGSAQGDADHEFYQIRGATRLADGTIVVANGGSSELRYYAPDGSLRVHAGRKGGGPGEFQMLAGLQRIAGDSVLATDAMQRRASVFDASGRHARDFATGDASTIVSLLVAGRLGDGTYVAQATNMRDPAAMLNRPEGPTQDSLLVLHLDAKGAVLDTLGLFPGLRMNIRMVTFGGRKLPMPTMIPFSPATAVTAAGDRVYVGVPETYQVAMYTSAGTLQRLIRKAYEPRPVTPADADSIRARLTQALDRQSSPFAAQLKEAYADIELPETMPAFARLEVDGEGNLWVADYPGPTDEHHTWTVFDRDGRLLGTVAMPRDFRVADIGGDYVLGYGSDATEVERVLLYALIKPSVD